MEFLASFRKQDRAVESRKKRKKQINIYIIGREKK